VLEVTCEGSMGLNACQHVDSSVFRDRDRRPEREKGSWRETLAPRQGLAGVEISLLVVGL
jgi:hypothetical protein